jgi:streptomycin 6-kinase
MDNDLPPIPDSLVENLAFNLGAAAAATWLEGAVLRARVLCQEWELRPLQVLSGGSMSLCIKCAGPGGELLVLKIPASLDGGAAEIAALRAWGGNGAARVIRTDRATCAVLMNYLGEVGQGGYGLEDIVDLAERLHQGDPGGYDFGTVDDNLTRRINWATDRFQEDGYERHKGDLALAEKLVVDLVFTDDRPVLLHGDLQAKNLILSGDELTAVDPLPVLGPAIFDVAFWIAKSVHQHPTLFYVKRVAELRPELDVDALLRWTWALAVLENRPYIEAGAVQRQEFIDGLRSEVTG